MQLNRITELYCLLSAFNPFTWQRNDSSNNYKDHGGREPHQTDSPRGQAVAGSGQGAGLFNHILELHSWFRGRTKTHKSVVKCLIIFSCHSRCLSIIVMIMM